MAHSILQMLQMDLTHTTRCQCHSATQEALSAEEPEPFLRDGGNTAQDCLMCFRCMSPSAIHTFLLTHRHLIIRSPELGSPLPILTSVFLSSSSPQEIPHQPPRPEIWVPWASLVAQMVKNLPEMQETWIWPLGQEDPLEKDMATHSSILAWKNPMHRGDRQATVHGVAESKTTEWVLLSD